MTEEDAIAIISNDVPRETMARLRLYVDLMGTANTTQNLISTASMAMVWRRHILDAHQLTSLGNSAGLWADIGTGAGLPGLVVAIITNRPTMLIEPRALRVQFLEDCVRALGLEGVVSVVKAKAQTLKLAPVGVISARAVAGISALFEMATHLASNETRWVLPRGKSADEEVAEARRMWQFTSRSLPSITDPDAAIIVAEGVRPRERR